MSTADLHRMTSNGGYWDRVVDLWNEKEHRDALWRAHSDAVNAQLLDCWLPSGAARILKTDLFDEAVAEGLYPILQSRAQHVTGIDVSPHVVEAARIRYPRMEGVVADVLQLPFSDHGFDAVVSMSTLDHFDTRDDICAALAQVNRVLAPGGTLIITLDNAANPAVALRNSLPHGLLCRLGVVPYSTGVTCNAKQLVELLRGCGFEVADVTHKLHIPRMLAVWASRLVQQSGSAANCARFLRLLARGERLNRWPTRTLTGYYVAVKANKR